MKIEYNISTSAELLIIYKDEDIVRYSFEKRRMQDKEPVYNIMRSHSISEESTRFCNYSKDKFDNELTFIKPEWLDIPTGSYNEKQYSDDNYYTEYTPEYSYMIHLLTAEATYKRLIKEGWTPQQARQVLPLSTKVQTIHTAFNDDWEEFIKLRADACSGSVHPNMKRIAVEIKNQLYGATAG